MKFDSFSVVRFDLDIPINVYANSYGVEKPKEEKPFIWVENNNKLLKISISEKPKISADIKYKDVLKKLIEENYNTLIAHWQNKINDRLMLEIVEAPIMFKKYLDDRRDLIIEDNSNNGICYDGVVDLKHYCAKKKKLMFLLKETNGNKPNGEKNNILTDWDYMKWVKEQAYQITGLYRSCYRNIAMWSKMFSIYTEENRVPDANEFFDSQGLLYNESLCKSLLGISLINLKKSWGTESTDWNNMNKYLDNTARRKIIEHQIAILKPDIVLCGGTFDFAFKLFGEGTEKIEILINNQRIEFFEALGTTFAKCYHPSMRSSYKNSFNNMNNIFANIIKRLKGCII